MPIKETVLKHIKENRGRLRFVAKQSGVPYHTLIKISSGHTKNPGIDHIQRLYDFFMRIPEE
jgi:predicted transcriptional regulator|tara:strand:- start:4576 stop:4761 length:186 start_codon:yes stop_codon:yes gene_type:complete